MPLKNPICDMKAIKLHVVCKHNSKYVESNVK